MRQWNHSLIWEGRLNAGTKHYPISRNLLSEKFQTSRRSRQNYSAVTLWAPSDSLPFSGKFIRLPQRPHLLTLTFCTVRCALFIGSEPLERKPQAIITATCQAACPLPTRDYVSCHRKPNGRYKWSVHRFYLAFGSFPFPCIYYTTPIGKCQ